MTPDVNVLVTAARADHPHNAAARAWLQDAVNASDAGTPFTFDADGARQLPRLVTSPTVFGAPRKKGLHLHQIYGAG